MRYLLFLFLLFSVTVSAQIRDYQIKSDSPYDTLWVLTNDTATASPTYKLGYWRNARDLFTGFNDRDWLRYRTDGIPNNVDTMYHDGIVTIGDDSTYTGILNIIGRLDLRFPDTSATNMMIGKSAGNDLVTGQNNFGFGAFSLKNLTTGNYNIAIGDSSIYTNTVSSQNVAIGVGSMKNGSAPRASVGVGYQTLYNMSSALGRNTAIGFQAGRGLTSGTYNVFIGYQSGLTTTGGSNTFIGGGTANGVTTGVQNVIIGSLASEALTTGSRNILIGYDVASSFDGSDRLYIDPSSTSSPLIYGNFDQDTILINGKLGFTTTAGTATTITGRNGTQFTNVGTGWGIDLVSGNLVVDSSQVATQYDLTTISGGSNDHDWYEVGGTTPPDNIDDNMFSGTGNHGIGTTSPAKPLHVVGEARITGSGGTATTITGRDTDEDITDVTTGWGIDLTSGALVVDSSQVATQYDLTTVLAGGMTHWYAVGNDTGGAGAEINDGETVTFDGGTGTTVTQSGNTILITEGDGSATNELDTMLLSVNGTGGTANLVDGVTLAINGAGINTITRSGTTVTVTGTEVDGDATNEVQTITVTGASAPYTLDLSLTSSDMAFDRSGIITLTESPANTLIIGATEVDGSTSNELNTIEENNVSVQTSNTTLDFQNPFDLATDGAGEVNISFDGGEFITDGTVEGTEYLLLYDADTLVTMQRTQIADLFSEVLTVQENDATVITTATIDFGSGFDITNTGSEANVFIEGADFPIDGLADAGEYVLIYDSDTSATTNSIQRRSIGTFGDGNGIFSASNDGNTVPTDMDVLITDHIDFEGGLLYVDNTNNRIGVNTATPATDLNVVGVTRLEATASSAQNLYLVGKSDGGGVNIGETFVRMNYVDADYASGAEQAGVNMTLGKYSDLAQWSVFKIIMPEATDADILIGEKNADFSNNTAESHVLINGGIAFAQNYEWTGAGADLTLDRSYYNVSVSGAGAIGDEIFLPEINASLAGTDNWDGLSITAAQCQVGQVYTITNFRASTNLVVKPATGDLIKTGTSITLTPNQSVRIEAVRLSGTVGYWAYWLSD